MKIAYGLRKVREYPKPVVVLGVFDGVHLGHRAILKSAVKKAKAIKGTSVAVTFWPHPQKEKSLHSLKHRLRLIAATGIDLSIVIKFNRKFAQVPAEDFVKKILFKKLHAKYVYVGRNFRFGMQAKGDINTLAGLSKIYHFKLKASKVIRADFKPVSSTTIRALIEKGKLAAAERLLERPVNVLGTVVKGSSLARMLGFPTANINPHHEVIPPSGVYAVRVILENKKLKGVCNIGRKPTFQAEAEKQIEVHIFNFKRNIYGKYMEIQFIRKIRNEVKFASTRQLAEQIKKDILAARRVLSLP